MAISASAVWEVRTTGNDANGGFYVSGGTDYSQQDAAQLTVTDGVTNGTTTVTSPTQGGFTAAMVGNGINIAGTIRQITAVTDANTITVDASVTAASGQTMKVGGALASPGKAAASVVAGNVVYVKGTTGDNTTQAVYSVSSTTANVSGGRVSLNVSGEAFAPTSLIGYGTARNDGGTRPVLRATVASVTLLTLASFPYYVDNIELDGNAQTSSRGLDTSSAFAYVRRVRVAGCTNSGLVTSSSSFVRDCYATGCNIGYSLSGSTVISTSVATACTAAGFQLDDGALAEWCIAYANTGPTTDGFVQTANKSYAHNCVAHGNGRHGFVAAALLYSLRNCIAQSNGGFGFTASGSTGMGVTSNCAGRNNTSGNVGGNLQRNENFVTMTSDPFTNAAGGDFSLNNTAGAGAACRAAGIPSAFPGGTTTGYLDIGAAQHQDSGTAGTTNIFTKSRLVNGTL